MRATLTIYDLYQSDNTLFANLQLPSNVDDDTLLDILLYDYIDFEVVYPDATLMKAMIGRWSARMLPLWNKLKALCDDNYDPLENYNRSEHWTDEGSTSGESSSTGGHSISSVETSTTAQLIPDSSSTASGETSGEQSNEHTGTISGNIGVTTSQQMAEQELAVRPKLDIYRIIAEDFKRHFCIMVY